MSDFITDAEQQYEVYCKIAEDYGFIDFNAKKNGFRCTTKSNEFNAGWIAFTGAIAAMREDQQAKIDQLKSQLALCREENKGLVGKVSEQRQINKSQLNKLINKSVRLTDAEFEYKRIRGLQAKDCLQIMRLTARNEKLNNELKTMRGVNDINLTR